MASGYTVIGTGKRLRKTQRLLSWVLFQSVLIVSLTMFRADTLRGAYEMLLQLMQAAGALSLEDAAVGLVLAAVAVFGLQLLEMKSGIAALGRQLVRIRASVVLFPVFVLLILGIVYFKGLTLEGVWISPADPFFNQGQEKFIYLNF